MLMLIVAWRDPDCSLPNDSIYLARITRSVRSWGRISAAVLPFWRTGEDGRLRQKRLSYERLRAAQVVAQKRAAGGASALKRLQTASTAVAAPLNERTNGKATTQTQTQVEDQEKGNPMPAAMAAALKDLGDSLAGRSATRGGNGVSFDAATPEGRANRKARWEQKITEEIRLSLPTKDAEVIIAGYASGDPLAKRAYEDFDRMIKARKAETH